MLAVPLLIYLVGYSDAHGAIGTTALAVSVNALLNVVPHAAKKHVDFKLRALRRRLSAGRISAGRRGSWGSEGLS